MAALRARILPLEQGGAKPADALGFGLAALDACLAGGGLAHGALHEVAAAGADAVHGAAAALFVAGIAARLEGPVLWCGGPDLFLPGLAAVGLGAARVVCVETPLEAERLAAMEEGLRHGGLAAVVGELSAVSSTASRRLQLAAESQGTMGFVLRRRREGREAARDGSAAVTRWRVAPVPSAPLSYPGIGRARWQVELVHARGGRPGVWVLEACDASGRLALPAGMADGSVAAPGLRIA